MYFRSQKKLQSEVSLSDSIETDKDGNALQLMDVVGVDDTMLEDLHDRDSALRVRSLVQERLNPREAEIIRLRYGLGGTVPLTQREVASSFGISRSYVSRIEKRALEKLRTPPWNLPLFPKFGTEKRLTPECVSLIKVLNTGESQPQPCQESVRRFHLWGNMPHFPALATPDHFDKNTALLWSSSSIRGHNNLGPLFAVCRRCTTTKSPRQKFQH